MPDCVLANIATSIYRVRMLEMRLQMGGAGLALHMLGSQASTASLLCEKQRLCLLVSAVDLPGVYRASPSMKWLLLVLLNLIRLGLKACNLC